MLTCLSANLLAGWQAISTTRRIRRSDGPKDRDLTQKGGVGKTTTVANLAAAWGARGRPVLAIDFGPQFALTRRFGIDPSETGGRVSQKALPEQEVLAVLVWAARSADDPDAVRRLERALRAFRASRFAAAAKQLSS